MKALLIRFLHAIAIGIFAYQDLKSLIGAGLGWAALYIYNIYCMHEFLEVHFFDRNEYIVVKFIGIYELWNLESNFFDTADIVVLYFTSITP